MSKLDYYKNPEYFKGAWKIDRIINNKKYPDQSCDGSGIANFFMPAGVNCLMFSEQMDLVFKNGLKIEGAAKSYKYEFKGHRVTKYYEEKQGSQSEFIKMFDLSFDGFESICARGSYMCNQDAYDCIIRFYNSNKFHLLYIVEGPNKNYISTTFFTRDSQIYDSTTLIGDSVVDNDFLSGAGKLE